MINSCVIYHQLLIATDDAIFAFISPGYYQVCFRLTYRPIISKVGLTIAIYHHSHIQLVLHVMMQNLL